MSHLYQLLTCARATGFPILSFCDGDGALGAGACLVLPCMLGTPPCMLCTPQAHINILKLKGRSPKGHGRRGAREGTDTFQANSSIDSAGSGRGASASLGPCTPPFDVAEGK